MKKMMLESLLIAAGVYVCTFTLFSYAHTACTTSCTPIIFSRITPTCSPTPSVTPLEARVATSSQSMHGESTHTSEITVVMQPNFSISATPIITPTPVLDMPYTPTPRKGDQ